MPTKAELEKQEKERAEKREPDSRWRAAVKAAVLQLPSFGRVKRYAKIADLECNVSWPVHACAYIVGGGTSVGKTTAGRMISIQCEIQGVPSLHVEMDEPGSEVNTPSREMFADGVSYMMRAASAYGKVAEQMTSSMVNAFAFNEYIAMFEAMAQRATGGVLVVDSIWRFAAYAASILEVPSPEKGVHPAYAGAAETLDRIAVRNNCAIFAVQNTQLFPIPNLDGATGGGVSPVANSRIIMVHDRNDRQKKEIFFKDEVWDRIIQMRKGEE